MTNTSELIDLFELFPNLELTSGNHPLYQRFRCLEPQLSSCLDDMPEKLEPAVLALEEKGNPLGMVSVVVIENQYKTRPANQYARIDLVIVDPNSRNLGIGRLLVLCTITYLLRTQGNRLYSISCLAAHEAMEKILKDLSFQERPGKEENFWRGELKLETIDLEILARRFAEQTSECLKRTNFRLRQRQENH